MHHKERHDLVKLHELELQDISAAGAVHENQTSDSHGPVAGGIFICEPNQSVSNLGHDKQ